MKELTSMDAEELLFVVLCAYVVYFDSQDRKQKRADDAKKPPAQNAADATRQMLESKVHMVSQNPHLWNMHLVKNLIDLHVYFHLYEHETKYSYSRCICRNMVKVDLRFRCYQVFIS